MTAKQLTKEIFHMAADLIICGGKYDDVSREVQSKMAEMIEDYAKNKSIEDQKACLAKAAERAEAIIIENEFGEDVPFICKNSITSEDNLI